MRLPIPTAATRLISALRRVKRAATRRARLEPFGAIVQLVWPRAIVQLVWPRALVFVDRTYARSLGLAPAAGATTWADERDDGDVGHSVLSGPLEAHLQLTNRCGAGCAGCYTGATLSGAGVEWGLHEWKRAVDELAKLGVFHVALGGGESAVLPWLGDIARHCRRRGLIPNLTTSGLEGVDRLLPIADLFGQINVSIDGLEDTYARVRGFDGFHRADAALRRLRARTRHVGINVVVTRHNFDELAELFAYAKRRHLNEVELLRFKPAGRGIAAYEDHACTDAQHRRLLPMVLQACKRHRVRVRIDCSYTPMIAHHQPDPALLAKLAVYGCSGGDFLIGARSTGVLTACSFAPPPEGRPRADRLASYWNEPGAFGVFRTWRAADEPCRSCSFHTLCRGGCKVVSAHVVGDPARPDPECPRVVDYVAAKPSRESARLVVLR